MSNHHGFENEIGSDLKDLEATLGYQFHSLSLLRQAMTHSSFTNELNVPEHHLLCNERMEFLGDSVLSCIVSEYLYNEYPELPEGHLTKMRSALVCGESLASFAEKLELNKYLFIGVGEQVNRNNPTVLENAFEATIGAIYLDSGCHEEGKEAVRKFLIPLITEELKVLAPLGYSKDYKSLLQQITQADEHVLPSYEVVEDLGEPGPERYTVRVLLHSNVLGTGKGPNHKKAEIAAAKDALALMGLIRNESES